MIECKFYGLKLPSGHRCPPCPMADDCQEAFEIKEDNKLFADLTHDEVLEKTFAILNKKNAPTYHSIAPLGLRENGARIVLFGTNDTSLALRLEYDRGRVLDSGRILEFYSGWSTTPDYKQVTKKWLEEVQEL